MSERLGQLVEEAVRRRRSKIWHHARYGLIGAGHVTHCGIQMLTEDWRDAHAVPKKTRCKRCDWSGL